MLHSNLPAGASGFDTHLAWGPKHVITVKRCAFLQKITHVLVDLFLITILTGRKHAFILLISVRFPLEKELLGIVWKVVGTLNVFCYNGHI